MVNTMAYLYNTKKQDLTREEETRIIKLAKKGSSEAKQKLINSHMHIILSIASLYKNHSASFEDLAQSGIIGLLKSIELFDTRKKIKFSTYTAYWIKQSITQEADTVSNQIRLPAKAKQTLKKIDKTRFQLLRQTGIEPSLEEIAKSTHMNLNRLYHLIEAAQEIIRLEDYSQDFISNNVSHELGDNQNPYVIFSHSEQKDILHYLIENLNYREKKIVYSRFAENKHDLKLRKNLAKEFHVSKERIRQIEVRAIQKIKMFAESKHLLENLKPSHEEIA